jgi:hypothetical protein
LTLFAFSATYLALGALQLPGLHWDAALYATPIVSVARGLGWKFDAFEPQLIPNPERIYDYHGVTSIVVYGWLLKAKSYKELLAWSGVFNLATFVAYTCLFRRALASQNRLSLPLSLLFGTLAGVICVGLQGRPEHLIPLILTFPLVIYACRKTRRYWLGASTITVGLVLATSPLPGLVLGIGSIALLALIRGRESLSFWGEVVASAAIATVTAAVMIQLGTPFGFLHWLARFIDESTRDAHPDFTHYLLRPLAQNDFLYGFTAFAPLWNWFVILTFAWIVILLIKRRCYASTAIMIGSAIFFTPKGADYTYICFFPAAILALFIFSAPQASLSWNSTPGLQRHLSVLVQPLLVLVGILYFGGFMRMLYNAFHNYRLQPAYVSQGFCRFLRRSDHDPTAKRSGLIIGFPHLYRPSMIALAGDDSCRFITKSATTTPLMGREAQEEVIPSAEGDRRAIIPTHYILAKSRFDPRDRPPNDLSIQGHRFRLTANHWNQLSRNIFGRDFWPPDPLANGYDIAIYRRIK